MVDHSRYYTNTYPDYVESEYSKDAFENSKGKIKEELLKYVKIWENEAKPLEYSGRDYSVYTGSAGYAVLYLNLYHKLGDVTYLQKAARVACSCVARGLRGRRLSYYCGDAGILTTAALVAKAAAGRGPEVPEDAAEPAESPPAPPSAKRPALAPGFDPRLASPEHYARLLLALAPRVTAQDGDLPDEVLYGRAGYLYALLLLYSNGVLGAETGAAARAVAARVAASGAAYARAHRLSLPLAYEWHGKRYYGAAHGVCGILCTLLQAWRVLQPPPEQPSAALLQRCAAALLQESALPSGNARSSQGSPRDALVQWCHGAPGFLPLLLLAKETPPSPPSPHLDPLATTIWQRGLLKKGLNLCHGTAGNAYAFLYHHQMHPSLPAPLHRLHHFTRHILAHLPTPPTSSAPLSLMEGRAGTLHLLADLLHPPSASFPGFLLPPSATEG